MLLITRLVGLFIFLFISTVQCEQENILFGQVNEQNRITLSQVDDVESVPKNAAVFAVFDNKIKETGWSFLEIHTSANHTDDQQSYSAGFIEGYITADLIWMHWLNIMQDFCDGQQKVCDKIDKYIAKNSEWMKSMVEQKSNTSVYWYQVKLFLNQLHGLADGYNEATTQKDRKLSYKNILYMNMDGDLGDLVPAYKGLGRQFGDGHCSALIKILPDGSDILTAHNTWSSYQSMLRIQKKYALNLRTLKDSSKKIDGHTMSFSSYPGILLSNDDFYVLSNRMVTLETTISNHNTELWKNISPVGQVLEFMRVTISNRIAADGKTWVDTFKKYNSGTYNNQWMVVDYKKFDPKSIQKMNDGFLTILEQMPGETADGDVTHVLRSQGYWPSYNIPYFPRIYNISGVPDMVKTYGDWFSYNGHPRALIFKRDHGRINNMEDMLQMMSYNDFKHDPYSRCNCTPPYSAESAIAARNDLNMPNGKYPFPSLSYRSHGAIDIKISGYQLTEQYQFLGLSGPPYNLSRDVPPFNWDTVGFGNSTSHIGHPTEWKFQPVTYKWLDNESKQI